MNRLRLLAMSDTHLGEGDSLLSYPTARRALGKVLRGKFGRYDRTNPNDTEPFEVDELILLGDIPDRTLSSTSLILSNVDEFTETLGSAAIIRKCVYLPGNHDHTTWSEYWKRRHGEKWGV